MVTPDTARNDSESVRLVLASASPARLELLTNAGLRPEVQVSGVDESAVTGPSADDLTERLARAKATAVGALQRQERALVIGCDSLLVLGTEILGKPANTDEAVDLWRRMRGRSGTLTTGHCVIDTATGRAETAVTETAVTFGDISDEEIHAYVATGEPTRVAGGFTLDGLGGPFVDSVAGDWSNVVGLSLPTLRRLLAAHGFSVTDLWFAVRSNT